MLVERHRPYLAFLLLSCSKRRPQDWHFVSHACLFSSYCRGLAVCYPNFAIGRPWLELASMNIDWAVVRIGILASVGCICDHSNRYRSGMARRVVE